MSKQKLESPTSSTIEIISKMNAARKTSNNSRKNPHQESFEWKVDLSSKDWIYISDPCSFETYPYEYQRRIRKYFDFNLDLEPDDNGMSNVRVFQVMDSEGFSFPLILEFSFYLNGQVYNVDEERPILLPSINKQLKPLVTELITFKNKNYFRTYSKRIILCKSADLFSLMVDNVVNIEFTIKYIE
jgi:hypothetical protein